MPTVRQITRFTEQEIKNLLSHARRILRSAAMDILLAPACDDFGKILVITPARIGNAPERNLLRRRVKAIYYQEKLFDFNRDCVIIAKAGAKSLDFDALKALLMQTLKSCPSIASQS